MGQAIKAEGVGIRFDGRDIYELAYSRAGCRVVVTGFALDTGESAFLEVFFPDVRAFRCLDEGDLPAYWASDQFGTGHCVYRLSAGGWLKEGAHGVLSVTASLGRYTEFLVATGDSCACIITDEEPLLRTYIDSFPIAAQ